MISRPFRLREKLAPSPTSIFATRALQTSTAGVGNLLTERAIFDSVKIETSLRAKRFGFLT